MKRFWLGIVAVAAVSACSGGNPFEQDTGNNNNGGGNNQPTAPEELKGDLTSFSYNAQAKTLTVRGVSLDNNPIAATYTRKPALDRPGYEAYTSQSGSLDRHSTAYVAKIGGTEAIVVLTGGQFGSVFGGTSYKRTGTYSPPAVNQNSGTVTYAGNYVGLLNGPGDGGDLLPVRPGTPADVRPVQAGEVTGKVAINADFADNTVNGLVFNRRYVDAPGITMENLELAPTTIGQDGTFTGKLEQAENTRGDYGGVFGGTGATSVAGSLKATNHVEALTNELEYGIFVLAQCGTANADPLCNQPNP